MRRAAILTLALLASVPARAGAAGFPGRCLTPYLEQLRHADRAVLTAEQRALLDYYRDPPVLSGAEQYLRFTRWNYASCDYDDGSHYRLGSTWRTGYGSVFTIASHEDYPVVGAEAPEARRPQPYGTAYVELIPDPAWTTAVFTLTGEPDTPLGVGVVGIPREEGAYLEQDLTAEADAR